MRPEEVGTAAAQLLAMRLLVAVYLDLALPETEDLTARQVVHLSVTAARMAVN